MNTGPILQALEDFEARRGRPFRWRVALSGGADSTALLLGVRDLARRQSRSLDALHVNHHLHPEAPEWVVHCRRLCTRLEVPLSVLDAPHSCGDSSETRARAIRYRCFEEALVDGDLLMLAHHRDDQVETLLLNLLRGTGLDGLRGMPAERPLGPGWLLRPLLDQPRGRLRDEVRQAGLDWIEDPGNRECHRPRNRLRHEVLPALREDWPALDAALSRTCNHLDQAATALEAVLDEDLVRVQDGEKPGTLDLSAWQDCPPQRRPLVLRHWLRASGLPMPDHREFDELFRQSLAAAPDRVPRVAWPGAEVRRYRDHLYALQPRVAPDAGLVLDWQEDAIELPSGLGRLEWERIGARPSPPPALTVRFRRGGERLKLAGRGDATHRLKKLMQDSRIPPWERGRIPLLYRHDELLAVADLWQSPSWQSLVEPRGLVLRWRRG